MQQGYIAMIVKFLATLFLLASSVTGQETYKLGGLDGTLTVENVDNQAGFYVLGDEVEENGLATEFCAIGKVNTEGVSNDSALIIIGRVIFFVIRASAAAEANQEYSIVGRVAVTYNTSSDILEANRTIVKNCTSDEVEVEEGDLVGVFIRGTCILRNNVRSINCPLQVNFIVDGDYGVEFFEDSDSVSTMITNGELESGVLQNQLTSIDNTFLNVEVTIEPESDVTTDDIEDGTESQPDVTADDIEDGTESQLDVTTDDIEDGTESQLDVTTDDIEDVTEIIEIEITEDLEGNSIDMLIAVTVAPLVTLGFAIVVIVAAVVILYMYKSTKKTSVQQELPSHDVTMTVENGNSRGENGEWSDNLPGATPHKNTQPVGTDTAALNGNYLLFAHPATYEVPVSLQEEHDYEEPYFEPASKEDDLLQQLKKLYIPVIEQEKELQNFECLGSGAFGVVHRGVWSHSVDDKVVEEEVAVKTMENGASEEDRVKFLQEAAIMGQFNHPNIVRLLGIITSPEPLKIVIELMKRGDLRKHLSQIKPDPGVPVSPELAPTLLSYSRQVTNGMMYLGVKSFVHRDLAARNILVSEDGVCKIADFGLSRDLQNGDYYVSHGGKIPVKWTAPEALHYRKYSTASDVWSFGCVLYEIWSLAHKPFHNDTNAEAMKKINTGFRLAPPPGCPRVIYEIMIQCWNPEVDGRPNFLDITIPLQKPDFQILKWSSEDMKVHSEKTRTLGTPLKHGQPLHKDLQRTYLTTNMTHQVKTDTRSTNELRDNYEHEDEMAKEMDDSRKVSDLDSKSIGDHHYEQDTQGDNGCVAGTSLESSDHYGQEESEDNKNHATEMLNMRT